MGAFDHFPYTNIHELNLDWVLKTCKDVKAEVDRLDEWRAIHEREYEQLKELYDQIIAGDFPESITQAFYDWMQRNAIDLVGSLVKTVFFGLTDDGHFIAYIPDSWSDIIFYTTGLDINIPGVEYGHLVLSY